MKYEKYIYDRTILKYVLQMMAMHQNYYQHKDRMTARTCVRFLIHLDQSEGVVFGALTNRWPSHD